MRPSLLLLPAVAASLIGAAAGCNRSPNHVSAAPTGEAGQAERIVNANIGGPLFAVQQLPPAAQPVSTTVEPILVPAHLHITDRGKAMLPAMRDSRIIFIGTEVKPTDPPIDTSRLYTHRDKRYRPLEAGDRVEAGDTVALLDDSEAFAKLQAAEIAAKSATEIYGHAQNVRKKVEESHNRRKALGNQISAIELSTSEIELARATATEGSQEAEMKSKEQELVMARTNYQYYTISAKISGIIQPFDTRPGQAVKAGETVLQIQSTDELKAEGAIAEGYKSRLRRLMPVTIEPTIEEAPLAKKRFHTQAVNGVAVSGHPARPLIVSVGDDRTARVWDGRSPSEIAIFRHPAGVRSVACSPRNAAKHYCLTGGEDGKARLWDMTAPRSGETPARELAGAHRGAISAVAFAPDGKTCATADAKDIALWDVESGSLKYKLPPAHLGEITSLTFTPQSKLVSAARDATLRVWSLGQDGGKLDFTQAGRSGDVGRLGVSHDGRYFLLDVAQTLRLMTLADRPLNEGVIEGVSEASKFAGFAIFSHDSQLVLTGNPNEGKLSVWRTPAGGSRATELRQFVPRERLVNFTCAAVSPSEEQPFAVTGTKSGELYVWPMPAERELAKIPGVLKYIDQAAAAATKQVRIWAEFANPKDRPLTVGTNVTIVIEPGTK